MSEALPKSRLKSRKEGKLGNLGNRSLKGKVKTSKIKASKENPTLHWPHPLQATMGKATLGTQARGRKTRVSKIPHRQLEIQVQLSFAPYARVLTGLLNAPLRFRRHRYCSVCVKQTPAITVCRRGIKLRPAGAITNAPNAQPPATRVNATTRNVTSDRWRVRSRNLIQFLHISHSSQQIRPLPSHCFHQVLL